MPARRPERVAKLVRQEVARMLVGQELPEDALDANVTITGAEISPDLRHAKVFYSVLIDSPEVRSKVQAAFARVAPRMRGEVGRRLKLKFAPGLAFSYDHSLDYAQEIDEIVERVRPRPEPAASDSPTDDEPT